MMRHEAEMEAVGEPPSSAGSTASEAGEAPATPPSSASISAFPGMRKGVEVELPRPRPPRGRAQHAQREVPEAAAAGPGSGGGAGETEEEREAAESVGALTVESVIGSLLGLEVGGATQPLAVAPTSPPRRAAAAASLTGSSKRAKAAFSYFSGDKADDGGGKGNGPHHTAVAAAGGRSAQQPTGSPVSTLEGAGRAVQPRPAVRSPSPHRSTSPITAGTAWTTDNAALRGLSLDVDIGSLPPGGGGGRGGVVGGSTPPDLQLKALPKGRGPVNEVVCGALAMAYERSGRWEEAVHVLDRARGLGEGGRGDILRIDGG